MGTYSDINENADAAHELVGDQFTLTQNWATTMMNQTLAFLNAMDTTQDFSVPDIVLKHELPDALDIVDFSGVVPGELILSYTTPTRPTVVVTPLDGIFLFSGSNYVSLIADPIIDKLLDSFTNGGTGLDSNVEEAIWNRALARKEAKDVSLYQETEEYFSSRGWILPPAALSGRLLEIQKEIAREDSQINYEIMIKQAELADQNTRHNLEQAIALEGLLRDYYIKYEMKDLEVAKAVSVAAIQEFETRLSAAKLDIEVYQSDIQAMIALIDAQVKAYLGQVQAYQAQADAYKSVVSAKAEVYIAEASVVKTEADIEIAQLGAEIQAFLGVAQLQAGVAEAAAKVAAQVAAGAMSAVNAGVSFSYGASQSASLSDSESEVHSYANDVQEILYSYE